MLRSSALLATLLLLPPLTARSDEQPTFETDVRPVLVRRCAKCHDRSKAKGGLDALSLEGLARGGESGESAIADDADESLLWTMLDGGGMPPEDEPQLTDEELKVVRRWLETNAHREVVAAERVTQHDVLPVLHSRCTVCHGTRSTEGGLDLRTVESILRGGKSGPVVVPGEPESSRILEKLETKAMPPPREIIRAGVRPMEPAEIEALRKWIAQGAREDNVEPDVQTAEPDPLVSDEDREFWSFRPPVRPEVPRVENGDARGAIDAFLLEKLNERGLTFTAEAPRDVLVRRVAFDLTGLPPAWEDLERFVADPSPDWYERMVDFYLASPRYGERWGRHWLDVAGYADSEGKRSADPVRPHAWRYRDYVIRALNDDKPYDRFLLEQLAGDELYDFEHADSITPEMTDALVATGFLRMAPDGTGSDIVDTVEERFEVVADEIEVLGSSVIGLTLRCAQCHDHKYDPIPQRDYYRLVATLRGAYDVYDWLKPTSVPNQSELENAKRRYLPYVSDEERERWEAARDAVEAKIAAAKDELGHQEVIARRNFLLSRIDTLPEADRAAVKSLLKTPPPDRTERQQELAKKHASFLDVDEKAFLKADPDLAKRRKAHDADVKKLRASIPPEPMIRALWDRGEPSPTWVFQRGQFDNPGPLVGPGVLSVLTDGRTPLDLEPRRPGSTGRRLALAEWLVQPAHPLTARVAVNRIWHHHFGRGIVPTLGNFGSTGEPPSHPALLDWLAVSFVEHGWSPKWLHREILVSTAYRQSSRVREETIAADPDGRLLSRMPLRRLDAESVRDALLAVAGQLDDRPFGKPDGVSVRDDGLVTSAGSDRGRRRTVYVQQRRTTLPTILETFDLPQMSPNCVERRDSTVASQALLLSNNGMVRDLSLNFAERVASEVGKDREARIRRVYEIALGRHPDDEETHLATETLDRLTRQWADVPADDRDGLPPETRALANLCRVVLNSAEFLYVD